MKMSVPQKTICKRLVLNKWQNIKLVKEVVEYLHFNHLPIIEIGLLSIVGLMLVGFLGKFLVDLILIIFSPFHSLLVYLN